jgi:hypothetical protein
MDDLTLLREARPEHPLRRPDELAGARRPLLAAMVAAPSRRPAWLRFRWAGLAVSGLAAAAVAGTLLLVPGTGPAPHQSPTGATPRLVSAAQVLHSASRAALTTSTAAPRPDQYVYTKTGSRGTGGTRESWLSADGTHDGLIVQPQGTVQERIPLPGCRDGRTAVVKGDTILPGRTDPCTPAPAYRADLPTDPDAMLAYLERHESGKGTANSLGKDVLSLINEAYLSPAQRSALFQAASRIDGLSVVRNATDGAGRHGIGVAWTYDGVRAVIVFDGTTYALLGTDSTAILASSVVDRVGQR